MERRTLNATPRTELGHQVAGLRRAGSIPAVVYGRTTESRPIAIGAMDLHALLRESGESTLIDLAIAGAAPVQVLVQDVARHPVTDAPIHVDFHQVAMDEEIHASIPVKFIGIAPAIKATGGVLIKQHDHVDVRALPQNLIEEITIDLGVLETLADAIHMKDIPLPEGVTLAVDPEAVIAKVAEVRRTAAEEAQIASEAAATAGAAGAAPAKEGAASEEPKKK